MGGPRHGGDDVYAALLADALAGRRAHEVVERDDGYVIGVRRRLLLARFARWDDADERSAMRFVGGRVLDVGYGGGRVSLHLQERGLEIVGSTPRLARSRSAGGASCSRERRGG